MKKKNLFLMAAFSGMFILIMAACLQTQPKVNPINPAFGKYIAGYTSGMVSRKTTIRIELTASPLDKAPLPINSRQVPAGGGVAEANAIRVADSVAFLASRLPDSSLLDNVFSFEPELKGRAVWVSDRVVEYIPSGPLPPNQFYNVRFNLDKIVDVEKELRTFNFQLSTFAQNLSVTLDGLRSYDEYNIEWQKLSGTIKTTDFEDTANIRKVLRVAQNGKQLPMQMVYTYNNNEFRFYIDSIERKKTPGKLLVTWSGEPVGAMGEGKEELPIPALGDFYVTNARVVDNNDQSVDLTFSDPLAYNQNLRGIVNIQGIDNLTYAIEGNLVRFFLPNRLVGTKLITVTTGIKNFKGYKMNKEYSVNLTFEEPKPMVRIKGNGNILPNSRGLLFPFEAISLKAVDVRVMKIFENNVHQFLQVNNLDGNEQMYRVGKVVAEKRIMLDYDKNMDLKQWNKHVIDLGKLISPDPGAIYRVSIKFNRTYALCNCGGGAEAPLAMMNPSASDGGEDWNDSDFDYEDFDSGYDHWDYSDGSYTPCHEYYYNGKGVSRNILASDLGLIYKLDDNKFSLAFVSSLVTAKPLANVLVEYYDYTRQLIASGVTNADGMMGIQLKRKPFLMLAKLGKQRGYLKLQDGYANSLSKFDVEGEAVQDGVKGFIYGERGVWRPGDSLFINFILEDKLKRLPSNHPVKFELQNPDGQVIYHVTKTRNFNGLYDFRTATSSEAPTGYYTAIVKVGNRTFSEGIKIETVKPNRLKIYMEFLDGKTKDTMARLSVKWLHGATAGNLEAMMSLSVNQTETSFGKFRNYCFDSPIRSYYSESEMVFSGKLNDRGEAYIHNSINPGQNAPGMLRATYLTKVFEEGGDFSIDRNSTVYSPYRHYIGIQTPETGGYDNTLEAGKSHDFDVVSLTEKGELADLNKLQVKIYKIQWRWWYEKDNEDLSQYVAKAGAQVAKDTIIKTIKGKGRFRFGINYPEYGRYLVTITDLEGGHQTGKIIYIDWPRWSRGNHNDNENASMLNFACDKEKYNAGEKIKLSFPSPSDGMALVSIETGVRVVQKFWISTKKGETTYEFAATAKMSPNAYVHVTLLQPHANTQNDLPIRMYGVVPVLVDDPATHLMPEVRMPEVVKPESVTRVVIKEKTGKKMNYTLALVDEGLLDLTRFKTPQPWNTFYARQALGVKTWDMYDFVIGAYAGKLNKLLSVGGDGDAGTGKSVKANRFKPMVKFLGPYTLETGRENTHLVQIPNYVGSLRVMVVAENEGAYGNYEKTVAVRKPLMVLATLPRVLGPGEEVHMPVDIFAMEKHVKEVKVSVEANSLLSVVGKSEQVVHFKKTGDEVVNFRLNVAREVGIAKVKVNVTCGSEKASQEIELDVRTPNPKVVDGLDLTLEPGQESGAEINFTGVTGTNKATIEFSAVPPLGLESRLTYLVQYPHGCIEQTTSSVFPQLFVTNLLDMNEKQKANISNNVKAGLQRLQLFQTANGGFSYWPGEYEDSEWGSNYAGHFMLEAEKQGYSLPLNMKARWVKYQQQKARNWIANNGGYSHPHGNETNEVIQAYRLFVLALAHQPEMGAMNRLREERNLSATAKWRLATAYKLVGQNEVALALIQDLSTEVPRYKELSHGYGSEIRDKAMILETLSLMNEKSRAASLVRQVALTLNSQEWLSTQETAYCLLAICQYTGLKEQAGVNLTCKVGDSGAKTLLTKKMISQMRFSEKDFKKRAAVSIKNNGKSTLFVKVITEGVPLVGDKTATSNNLKMEVKYKDMKGKEIQPDRLLQGSDFVAEVTITNPGSRGYLREMALNQIFPSGWEIHNTRMDGAKSVNLVRYQDIRDDRVYSYYEMPEKSSKTFVIQLNATYLGRFYLPTLYSEAMYDNTINARVPGRWVEVVNELHVVASK